MIPGEVLLGDGDIELNAGHFVLYEQEDGVLELIDSFCGAH